MSNIAFVGEAWGEVEAFERKPFVGPTGYAFTKMLEEVGIQRNACFLTNVFNLKPPANDMKYLCGPKNDAIVGYPALIKAGYVSQKYKRELDRLRDELEKVNPNVVVALGNVATWALLGKTGITKLRGVTQLSTHTIAGFKVYPAFHPAYVMRDYYNRPTFIADLRRIKKQSRFPEVIRPSRRIWINPTLEDIVEFDIRYIKPAQRLAVDIETFDRWITCIGIAPSAEVSIVIPIFIPGRAPRAYWQDHATSIKVKRIIRGILGRPIPKTFQNGLYDIAFLWRAERIKVVNAEEDTMLLHHALYPEAQKSLGYMGSLYTDEGSWKTMRSKSTIKRED